MPVVAVAATTETLPLVVRAVGNVEPVATVTVKPQVGGAITEQRVRDGAEVAKGELLFRIDPRPYELAIREAQAKLDRDKALLVKAEEDLRRYVTLKAKDVVAQGQYDETYSQAKTLEGTIRLTEASLARSRLDLEYSEVRAPIAGQVGSVLLTVGNVVKANDDRVMCVINQISPIFISISEPERYLPAIRERAAKGELTISALPAGEEGRPPVTAELASVDNAVDAKTGSIRLKAASKNTDHRLWPGQFVRVGLNLSLLEGVVVIPTKAVMDGLNGPYVYVVAPDGLVDARRITPGPIVDDRTVVQKGLAGGEMVVVDGQVRLAPGARAEIKPSGQATAANGAARTGAVQ
ncbi:efflux RND transporter periplasmic adaptor subunit [Solidesulfovibrio sp.]|uniref:efflux RND transporter periplasmic adaptor subunit n=1 Tax=Solidesulfovibrio sp. TaxID=2910990 RepID=UPI002B1F5DA5|nr:efflux RND transporter periplasmic adaptor subunit [Solidesulfovibrio sp.]MEA4854974.1 efflux RND transporter periplasmic adaptor subunit [Solidesulfovibrio sp.]